MRASSSPLRAGLSPLLILSLLVLPTVLMVSSVGVRATAISDSSARISTHEQLVESARERTQVVRLSDPEYVHYDKLFDHSEKEDPEGLNASEEAADDAAANAASNAVADEDVAPATPLDTPSSSSSASSTAAASPRSRERQSEAEAMRFRAARVREQGLWDSIKKGAKAVVGAVKNIFSPKKKQDAPSPNKGGQAEKPLTPNELEDCVACRLVWKQVEMAVGNARFQEDVMVAFEKACMEAQKSTIFFTACNDMYADIAAFTDDYMSNKFVVGTMCKRAGLCRDGKLEFPQAK
jgi:hypothetical protein